MEKPFGAYNIFAREEVYIYIKRERERERASSNKTSVCLHKDGAEDGVATIVSGHLIPEAEGDVGLMSGGGYVESVGRGDHAGAERSDAVHLVDGLIAPACLEAIIVEGAS
jgi:hypothetical protein